MHVAGYSFDGPIGSGAGGVTWLARDADGQAVAVRLLGADRPADADARRLDRLRGLRHPHLAGVLDLVPTQDGGTAVVSEAVPGPTLATVRISRGGLGAPEAAGVGAELAAALAVLHTAGLVHGDISPGNVVLVPDRGAVLVDLAADPRSERGTSGFAAPEVEAGASLTAAADVYALARLVRWLTRTDQRDELPAHLGAALAREPQDRCTIEQLGHALADGDGLSDGLPDGGHAAVDLPGGPALAAASIRDHADRAETRRKSEHRPRHRRETKGRSFALIAGLVVLTIGAGIWLTSGPATLSAPPGGHPSVVEIGPEPAEDHPAPPGAQDGSAGPHAAATGVPDAGGSAGTDLPDPVHAVHALTRARDRALNEADPHALRELTVPGSPAARGDATVVEQLTHGRMHIEGLQTRITRASAVPSPHAPAVPAEQEGPAQGPEEAEVPVWVRVQMSIGEHVITTAQGRQVVPATESCAVLGLEPGATDWQVARIGPC